MATTTQRMLTKYAESIALKLAERFGSLKSVLSAGIMALNELSPTERELMFDKANGIQATDEPQKAAEGVRYMLTKWQGLNEKDRAVALQFLSPDENRVVNEMLAALSPEHQVMKRPHKTKAG